MLICEYCSADTDERYRLALEWPPEEPDEDDPNPSDDPGAGELLVCGECADAVASNVLVGRALARGLEDVYASLEPGAHADASRCEVADD